MAKPKKSRLPPKELERRYFTLLSNLPGMVFRCKNDPDWSMQFMSEACKKITGYTVEEFLDVKKGVFNAIIHHEDRKDVWNSVQKAIQQEEHYEITYRIIDKQGKEKWVWEQGVGIKEDGEEFIEGFIQDITEKKLLEEEKERLYKFDPLTSLPNRYYIEEFAEKLFDCSGENAKAVGVLIINIKKLKKINDTYGHKAGDVILKKVANLLKVTARNKEIIARLESDKFVIISSEEEYASRKLGELAKYVINILSKKHIIGKKAINLKVSVGISISPNGGSDIKELIEHAEYASKSAEPGEYTFYNPEEHKKYLETLIIEDEIQLGLRDDQFCMVYQPIVNLQDQKTVSIEALVRWNHPSRGVIHPDYFVGIAEQTKLISELENVLFEKAFSDYKRFLNSGNYDIKMAINISIVHMLDDDFSEVLANARNKYNIPSDHLVLELTETSFASLPPTNKNLMQIANSGFTLAIDDFGTGHSSLERLFNLPFKDVKIDKLFIQNLKKIRYAKLIKAIVNISTTLGMDVIAEGVETKTQHNYLKKIGCKYAQGFYYAKPMKMDDLINYLKAESKSDNTSS